MLWLVGVMGVLVVGVVACLDLSPEELEDETEHSEIDDFLEEHGVGLVSLSAIVAAPLPRAVPDVVSQNIAGPVQEITDFDARADDLVVVWDDSTPDEPDVRLVPSNTAPDLLEVTLDDVVIARVPKASGLSADHVALLPQSAARALGWLEDAENSPV